MFAWLERYSRSVAILEWTSWTMVGVRVIAVGGDSAVIKRVGFTHSIRAITCAIDERMQYPQGSGDLKCSRTSIP
jgi:hypothetical protein